MLNPIQRFSSYVSATFDTINHYLRLETCTSLGFQDIVLFLTIPSQLHWIISPYLSEP